MINRLNQTLERKGLRYVENLLDENLVISEKIDTFRIIFKKEGDEINFYKKNNTPITIIDRTLTDIYENLFIEIPIITKDVQIPEGYYFGLYYTPVERPIRIPYSKLPKYILTDVTKRDEKNKVIESLDYESVKNWAAALCMGRPPIIYEGVLTEEQKETLIAYDAKDYKGEISTFPEMITRLFGTTFSQEHIIEGIIIKSKDKLAQVISYEFDLLNEAYEKENESRDFYDITISDLNEFLESYNIPILEAENKDQLYINIVSDIFNNYCKTRAVNENISEKYLMPPQFGYMGELNKIFIKNDETLTWLNKAPIYEALFKVFLSSFRKYKKPYGLLTEAIVKRFNTHVKLINNYINDFDETPILNEARSENIVIDAFKRRKPTDVDNMRVIASIQKAFEPKIRDVEKGKTPCVAYITTFDPFTNAQYTNIRRIKEMWNCPVILFAINSRSKIKGKKFHASDEIIRAQMQLLMNDDNSLVPGFALLSSWSLIEVFEYCRPTFEPIAVITDENKKSEMTLQLFFEEEIMGGRINVDNNFNVGELKNEDKLMAYRAIEDSNFSLFKELTPQPIHNVMEKIFAEYRLWSGQIIKPIND